MQRITLDMQAGEISSELVRRGIPAHARVHELVELTDEFDLSTTSPAQAGGAFDFLVDEPDLYSDRDLVVTNPLLSPDPDRIVTMYVAPGAPDTVRPEDVIRGGRVGCELRSATRTCGRALVHPGQRRMRPGRRSHQRPLHTHS